MTLTCDSACRKCLNKLCTHKIPLFSSLNRDDLEHIAGSITHSSYNTGETIISMGEKSNQVTIVSEGRVKACRYTADGKEQILYIFAEGDFFGEQDILNEHNTPYQVEALTQVKLCRLSQQDFQNLLTEHPSIGLQILKEFSSRLQRLEKIVQGSGGRSIDARVSLTLLELAAKYGQKDEAGVLLSLPLSREGLANYMGIARETASRKLSQLENDGIIESLGHKAIWIRDPQALERIAELI